MMELANKIVLLLLCAAVGEGVNEFFFIPWLDTLRDKLNEIVRVQLARMWSGLVGIAIAWELQVDIFDLLGARPVHPLAGFILTGLLLGRGSNWVHELIKRIVLNNELRQVQLGK